MAVANVCPCCGQYVRSTMKDLLHHVRLFHADEPNFSIQCSWHGCIRTFRNFHTFRNHVYAFHCSNGTDELIPPSHPDVDPCITDNNAYQLSDNDSDHMTDQDTNDSLEQTSGIDHVATIRRAAAVWILKVRECHHLPQSVLDAIIQDIESLYQVSENLILYTSYNAYYLTDYK